MIARRATPPAKQPRTLLLACGNNFRGDDGVGWCIGGTVAHQPPCHGLTVLMTRQLLPEHAEAISSADVVVFVDCSAVSPAGTVSTMLIEPAETPPSALTHHLDPASLLRLALDLYACRPTQALLVTVGGESFGWTDQLSKSVKSAVPQAVLAVREALLGTATPSPASLTH